MPDVDSQDSASQDGASQDGAPHESAPHGSASDGSAATDGASRDGAPRGGAARADDAQGGAPSDEAPVCSSRGCRREAAWMLLWRNPRIHGSDRVKRWAACDEHLPVLREYLTVRGFPCAVETVPPSGTVQ